MVAVGPRKKFTSPFPAMMTWPPSGRTLGVDRGRRSGAVHRSTPAGLRAVSPSRWAEIVAPDSRTKGGYEARGPMRVCHTRSGGRMGASPRDRNARCAPPPTLGHGCAEETPNEIVAKRPTRTGRAKARPDTNAAPRPKPMKARFRREILLKVARPEWCRSGWDST